LPIVDEADHQAFVVFVHDSWRVEHVEVVGAVQSGAALDDALSV
jgi:hypothetical protein